MGSRERRKKKVAMNDPDAIDCAVVGGGPRNCYEYYGNLSRGAVTWQITALAGFRVRAKSQGCDRAYVAPFPFGTALLSLPSLS